MINLALLSRLRHVRIDLAFWILFALVDLGEERHRHWLMACSEFFALPYEVRFEIEFVSNCQKGVRKTRLGVLRLVATILKAEHQALHCVDGYFCNCDASEALIVNDA